MRISTISTTVFLTLAVFGSAPRSVAAPIVMFDLALNHNYGEFRFGDWGFDFHNEFFSGPFNQTSWSLPDFEFDAVYTASSNSLLGVNERVVDSQTVHEYVFGPGVFRLSFNYVWNGVPESGAIDGTIGRFKTTVYEDAAPGGGDMWSGGAPVTGGTVDVRTAELFGLSRRIGGGELYLSFDNERRLLGHYGDGVREVAGYDGPLALTVPEPSMSALLLVAAATLGGLHKRRRKQ